MLAKHFNHTRPIILFDYETTGLIAKTARVCSVSMHVHRPDGTVQDYFTLVNPTIPIPKAASDVHGITDDIIRTGCARCWRPPTEHKTEDHEWRPIPRFADIGPNMHRGFVDADFAGYNIRYDLEVSVAEFERIHLPFSWSECLILDALRMWQKLEPRTLEDAVEHFLGRKMEGAHDARADTRETNNVIVSQLTRHPKREVFGDGTLKALHDVCFPRDPNVVDNEGKFVWVDGVLCFGNWGKHRGQPVRANMNYIQWMFGADFSSEIRKLCDRFLAGDWPKPPTQ